MKKILEHRSKEWYAKRLAKINKALKPKPAKPKRKKASNVSYHKMTTGRTMRFKGKTLEKQIYWGLVWDLTEQNDLTVLPNHSRRGFRDHHLDHKVSISYGFANGILPRCIADISNLQFIPWRANQIKNVSCVETELYVSSSTGLL